MAVVHDFICPPEFEPEEVNPDDPSQIIADFEDENIELWMIKAPFNFDVSLLSGHELKNHFNIPSKDKSDTEYVAVATENHPMHQSLQAVVPHKSKNKLKIGPSFKGYIDIVQSVAIPKCDNPTLPQEKTYHIPSNLKQRYIPYGSRSPPRISSSQIVKTKSKKRKRSSELLSLPMSDFDASQVSQMESEEPHLKKKRKKNREKDLDESTVSVGEMTCSGSVLSFQASETVSESYLPSSVTMEEVCSEKKKKRKRSRHSLEENLLKSVQGETPKLKEFYTPHCDEELTQVREKKKRKKNRDEIDETFFENLQGIGNTESFKTHTMSEEKKKKKHRFEKEKEEKKIENVDENMTAGELARKDSGFGSLEMEFDHLNSLDSVPEQMVSSSHKKKHKKKSLSETSLDETYSQLNIPKTNDESKTEHVNQDVMASSSHKKKRKKKSHSGNSLDETNAQFSIPITNDEQKNIDDVIHNEMVSFMDSAVELSRADRDNKSLEFTHLNSQDSVQEQTVSPSRKKKKKKKKNSLSENSLDETYSQLNIPITKEDEKNMEDGNQDVVASSMDTTGELARKTVW
ncbi:unnamed protein product [Acanthosepion pharaonis]|uniref:Uncharacterized protein n=1 Tax=Acanthosepion pharaonis TaxID=158019 RepID=A0A812C7S7_ACAPH|nr:unnamed protein product [Sepia pharaonis]